MRTSVSYLILDGTTISFSQYSLLRNITVGNSKNFSHKFPSFGSDFLVLGNFLFWKAVFN